MQSASTPVVERFTMASVHWCNEERLYSYFGHVPLVELEAEYYARLEVPLAVDAANIEAA